MSQPRRTVAVGLLATAMVLTGCSGSPPEDPVATTAPEEGVCRLLDGEDVEQASDDSPAVDCSEEHTAETFAVGTLPEQFTEAERDAPEVRDFGRRTCDERFRKFVGADESLALRTVLTWAWFVPDEEAWDAGARWYRCDVFAGGDRVEEIVPLPRTARDLLLGQPDDRWMACAAGPSVEGAAKVACSEPHDWRAVTTIVVGRPGDAWPGDKVVEGRSSDYCSESVGAWLNYPVDFDYGYTWFSEPDWSAGNRRSVCWARTAQ